MLGYYCEDGLNALACPAGTYGNRTGASTAEEGCGTCPPGKWYTYCTVCIYTLHYFQLKFVDLLTDFHISMLNFTCTCINLIKTLSISRVIDYIKQT